MNAKSIAMGVVAMVVATVLVVTCAVPIIADSVATEDTLTNEGIYYMNKYDTTLSSTIEWKYTEPGKIKINDDVVTLPRNGDTFPYTLLCSEDIIVRFSYISNSNASIQTWAEDWGGSQYIASTSNSRDLTITISSGTVTFDNGSGTTKSYTYSDSIYMISKTGDYVMKYATDSVYVNYDTSIIIGAGRSSVGGSLNFWITGTLNDGFTIGNTYGDNISPTFSEITYSATEDGRYIDLYQFNSLSFTATTSDVDYDVNYSQVIVPAKVTAERSVHVDGPTGDILAVIPVLMVLGIVIGAVALFLTTRRD